MRPFIAFVVGALISGGPNAQTFNMLPPGSSDTSSAARVTTNLLAQSYAGGVTRADEREAVLQRLKQVCHSRLSEDQRRCNTAWGMIHEARAKLDAQKVGLGH